MVRNLLILSFIFISIQAEAQKKIFVRVTNLFGTEVKGHLWDINDTILILQLKKYQWIEIPIHSIDKIKTKRSAGYNASMGALIGGVTFGGVAIAGSGSNTRSAESGIVGLISGAAAGALIGLFSSAFKKSVTFEIGSEPDQLISFKEYLINNNFATGKSLYRNPAPSSGSEPLPQN